MRKSKLFPLILLLSAVFSLYIFSDPVANAGARVNQAKYTFYSNNIKYEINKPASAKKAGQVTVLGAKNKNVKTITIPKTVKNSSYTYTVTKIADSAFHGYFKLAKISIPSSVTALGNSAFSDCDKLKSVILPNALTKMGAGTFYGCSSLKEVNIPIKLSYIPATAFYDCQNLQSITIPDGITYIGKFAFYGCKSLTNLSIPCSVTYIGTSAFKSCTALSSVRLSDNLAALSEFIFADCSSLKKIHFPDNLQYISNGAFSNCGMLSELIIPDTVVSIGVNAFEKCCSLENITLSSSLDKILSGTFANCSSLKTVTLPERLTRIEDRAFENCSSLRKVILNRQLTSIGKSAFYNCSSLTSIQLPDSLISLGTQAFKGCTSLSEVKLSPNITNFAADVFTDTAITLVSDNGLLILDGYLLNGTEVCGNIVIPDSVHCIAAEAFKNNEQLTEVCIPATVTSIGPNAFHGCSRLKKVQLLTSFVTLSAGAFYDCVKLVSVNLPDTITEIPAYSFYNCSSLQTITLPNNLNIIGDYAFCKCSSLKSPVFPANLSSIGSYAFSECSSLAELNIPKTIKWVGEAAFSSCLSLSTVKAGAEVIFKNAFQDCTSLRKVVLSNDVLGLGASAFRNCSQLSKVTLSDNLTVIEYFTFAGCKLSSIDIPTGLESILGGAFYNCKKLKTIRLPKNTFVADDAFEGCDIKISFESVDNHAYANITDQRVYKDKTPIYPDYVAQAGENVFYLSGAESDASGADLIIQNKSAEKTLIDSLNRSSGFIVYKDFIYYLDHNKNLCRYSLDMGKQTHLQKKVDILVAVYRDYIYYISNKSLYRATVKGKNPVKLVALSSDSILPYYRSKAIQLYDNSIYYVTCNSQNWLYRIEKINLDGSNHKILVKNFELKDSGYDIYLAGGRIYYQTNDGLIHCINENGSHAFSVLGNIHGVIQDELYYANDQGLWKITTENTSRLVVPENVIPKYCQISDVSADGTAIVLYYPGDDDSERGYLYLVNTLDYSMTIIADGDTISPARLIGDYLYYHKDYNYENGPVYYLRTRFR
ncbi:MAG: hypothetical protein ACFWTJ_05435 [Lachnoclostridium sp.]|jgi:hypothetical protein